MKWQAHQQIKYRVQPPALKNWLLDRGSLTDRLIEASSGRFRVNILQQRWGVVSQDEARPLGIKPRQAALVREVLLYGNNKPWVYARSILPTSSLDRSLRHLRRLGNKPLGAVLFSDPQLQRGEIEIANIAAQQLPVTIQGIMDKSAWGRRSVFFLQHQPLLVSEIFLPAFIIDVC